MRPAVDANQKLHAVRRLRPSASPDMRPEGAVSQSGCACKQKAIVTLTDASGECLLQPYVKCDLRNICDIVGNTWDKPRICAKDSLLPTGAACRHNSSSAGLGPARRRQPP